jgi:DNA polymerase I
MDNLIFKVVKTIDELRDYLKGFSRSFVVFDTETTGLTYADTLLGIALYDGSGYPPAFIFVDTPYFLGIPIHLIAEELYFLTHPTCKVLAHNAQFDLWVALKAGLPAPNFTFDSMIEVHLHDPELMKNLETRIYQDFGFKKPSFSDYVGKKWAKIDWLADTRSGLITHEILAKYACEDVYWEMRLHDTYFSYINENLEHKEKGTIVSLPNKVVRLYERIEIPLIKVLADMRFRGVKIDIPKLHAIDRAVDKALVAAANGIYETSGVVFNLNSPKQKAEILFDKLGLKSVSSTASGARSTDSATLEALKGTHPIIDHLIAYSELQKLRSGYTATIPKITDSDGRLRCSFNSCGTKTGRFSCSEPNLQNQPNNDLYNVRSCFIAEEGNVLCIGDFSQIEPRIMAHISRDEALCGIYHNGGDIYQGVADDLSITRKQAKVVVLAISYGMGINKLASSLSISSAKATAIMDAFYAKYAVFAAWKRYVEETAVTRGYVQTLFGRVRPLPALTGKARDGAFFGALRQAVNTVIQGSAADFCKLGMVRLHEEFAKNFAGIPAILLQVHDELVVECPMHMAEAVSRAMERIMENCYPFRVPIKFETKICNSWADMKDDNFKGIEIAKPRLRAKK